MLKIRGWWKTVYILILWYIVGVWRTTLERNLPFHYLKNNPQSISWCYQVHWYPLIQWVHICITFNWISVNKLSLISRPRSSPRISAHHKQWLDEQTNQANEFCHELIIRRSWFIKYTVCHVCSCFFHPKVVFMSFWCGLISHVPHQAASLPTQSFQHQHQTLPQQWHHLKLSVLKKYALVRGFKVVHRAGGGVTVHLCDQPKQNEQTSKWVHMIGSICHAPTSHLHCTPWLANKTVFSWH